MFNFIALDFFDALAFISKSNLISWTGNYELRCIHKKEFVVHSRFDLLFNIFDTDNFELKLNSITVMMVDNGSLHSEMNRFNYYKWNVYNVHF